MEIPTVYVGAYGYRDCDALGSIATFGLSNFHTRIQRVMEIEIETDNSMALDAGMAPEATPEDMWFVGPFPESLLETMRGVRSLHGMHHVRMLLDDLRNGSTHIAW